jgi:tetratricopeptide (TPR) repeat protein
MLLGAIVLACALIPYLPALRYDFVWDDRVMIGPSLDLKSPSDVARIWRIPFDSLLRDSVLQRTYFRPAALYSLAADRAAYHEHSAGFHATNLAWYALAVLFLWLTAWELTGRPLAATAGAALYALHPTHPESVCFISGRTDLMAAAFLFASLWAAARWGPRLRPAWRKLLPASLLLLPGLFAKEIALFGAPLLVLTLWLSERKLPARKLALAAIPVAAVAALYLACRIAVLGARPLPVVTPVEGTLAQILTSVAVVWWYIPLLLVPLRLSARHEIVEVHAPTLPFLLGLVAMAAILAGIAIAIRKRSPWSLPLGLYALTLFPVCYVRLLAGALVAERFLFAPSGALALAVALIPGALPVRQRGTARGAEVPAAGPAAAPPAARAPADAKPVFLGACAIAGVALLFLLLPRVQIWRDEGTLYGSMLRDSPQSPYVHAVLGGYYYERRDLARAAYHHRRAFELQPQFTESLLNLGATQDEMGQTDSAFVSIRLLLHLREDYAPAWYALGNLYVRVDRPDSARWAYAQALRLDPGFAQAENNLGAVLERTGRNEEALDHYRRAAAILPGYREASNNLDRLTEEMKRR